MGNESRSNRRTTESLGAAMAAVTAAAVLERPAEQAAPIATAETTTAATTEAPITTAAPAIVVTAASILASMRGAGLTFADLMLATPPVVSISAGKTRDRMTGWGKTRTKHPDGGYTQQIATIRWQIDSLDGNGKVAIAATINREWGYSRNGKPVSDKNPFYPVPSVRGLDYATLDPTARAEVSRFRKAAQRYFMDALAATPAEARTVKQTKPATEDEGFFEDDMSAEEAQAAEEQADNGTAQ